MQWDQLDSVAQHLKGTLGAVAMKTEVEVVRSKRYTDPSVLLVSVWTEAKGQRQSILDLIGAHHPKNWKKTRTRTKTTKDRFLWKTWVRVEYMPRTTKPLAVRLAEQGRPGQEKNPSYPT